MMDSDAAWPERILLLGASGFLGSHLFEMLSSVSCVLGTYNATYVPGLCHLDLCDAVAVKHLIRAFAPDLVVHCAGMTRPDACEIDPVRARRVNVDGTQHVLDATAARLLYFSTAYVFDGLRGGYCENDSPAPVNSYGETKAESESLVLAADQRNLIVRLGPLYGFNAHNNEFIMGLTTRPHLRRPTDLLSTQTFLGDVTNALPMCLEARGILHVSGPQAESHFSFTRKAVSELDVSTQVTPCEVADLRLPARRPRDTSLTSSRGNLSTRDSNQGLGATAAAWHAARCSEQRTHAGQSPASPIMAS